MKTRLVLLAVLALGALAGAGGCADNNASIQVQAICYPTPECSTDGGCEKVLYGVPTLVKPTVGSDARLMLQLQVENQLPENGDGTIRLNTNDAQVREVYVEYDTAFGEYVPPAVGTTAWIPAGTTGLALVALSIPASHPDGLIEARVRLRGQLDDQSSFETAEFPITFAYCTTCSVVPCAVGEKTCPPGAVSQDPIACIPAETTEPTPAAKLAR